MRVDVGHAFVDRVRADLYCGFELGYIGLASPRTLNSIIFRSVEGQDLGHSIYKSQALSWEGQT
jgi:hypothetical protein